MVPVRCGFEARKRGRLARAVTVCAGVFVFSLFCGGGIASATAPTILYRFKSPDRAGDRPWGDLIADSSGALYGATKGGATHLNGDDGTVYKLTPPAGGKGVWNNTLLHRFGGPGDGAAPNGGLVMDPQGAVYGTTNLKTYDVGGVIFKLVPPSGSGQNWTEQILVSTPGAWSSAPLLRAANGTLYGALTYDSGTQTSSIFSVVPPAAGQTAWTYNTLYTFKGGNDGAAPGAALISDVAGNLYGTTIGGGPANAGTVFELSPPMAGQTNWTEKQLYAFAGGVDGGESLAPVSFGSGGVLYGTTYLGGANGRGAVFQLTPSASGQGAWTKSTILDLSLQIGAGIYDGVLVAPNGALYTTVEGGNPHDTGGLLELLPPTIGQTTWNLQPLFYFGRNLNGHAVMPEGGLIFGPNNLLYGTTYAGGDKNFGTVFSIAP